MLKFSKVLRKSLSHIDSSGKASMVDITLKYPQIRIAEASCLMKLSQNSSQKIHENSIQKGDVFTVAKIAGIQAAKNTSQIIPLCHQINISHVELNFEHNIDNNEIQINSVCKAKDATGIEMEALTACNVAALTIYDMVKAVDQETIITDLKLVRKEKIEKIREFAP